MNSDFYVFSKEGKTGLSLFLNQLSSLSKIYQIEFYFYKKNFNFKYPKNSHFLNKDYPENYGFSLRKITYSLMNLLGTRKVIKESPRVILVTDLYSFILISVSLLFNQKIELIYLIEINVKESIKLRPFVLYRFLLTSIFKFLLIRVNFFVFPSKALSKDVMLKFKIKQEKVRIIPYGVSIQEITRKSKEKIAREEEKILNKGTRKIFSIGRLDRQKDFFTILKSFNLIAKKNKEVELFVVGGGDQKEEILKSKEYRDNKNRIHMLGYKKNIFPYLLRADLFLFSSLFEGFGIILLEAMAMKVPIIATNSPFGPGELLEGGENGVLIGVGEYEKMAEEVEKIFRNKSLKAKLIANGYRRAKSFSWSKTVSDYNKLFNEILNEKS